MSSCCVPGTVLNATIASIASVNAHNKVGVIVSPILDLEKLRLRKRERLDGLRVARGRFKPRAEDLRDVEHLAMPLQAHSCHNIPQSR